MSTLAGSDSDLVAINTIRFLAVDMVEKAASGHPGAPMGQAALAYWLWSRYLRFHPGDPNWPNRDRFVLSCGHASALLYALLHLSGYDLDGAELQRFRQLGGKTPGHPEHGLTPGVETTTGPLGQGLANAVGMAIAEKHLAAHFNRPGFPLINHRIWVLASDGDLMEGVAAEASSLAGHLRLAQLKVCYDANAITIDGALDLAFSEDVRQRYAAYGWNTLEVDDGNDLSALDVAIQAAIAEEGRPTLILVHTHIGFGSPGKQDTAEAHGSPLGPAEVVAAKRQLGWPLEPTFLVPPAAVEAFAPARARGAAAQAAWEALWASYSTAYPSLAAEFRARLHGELPSGWTAALPSFKPQDPAIATREASGMVLNALADHLPQLIGGSADLAGSNNTTLKGKPRFAADQPHGRNFHFGVREHAMGAILNGMALSKLLRPYGGTFLIFSDYMRPAIRLAALMELPTIYVLTHDSIFLGEDGPTHQPISQLLSMRSIPGLLVLRPADAIETVLAWQLALENAHGPTALALSRQKLPILAETAAHAAAGVRRGAYVLADPAGEPQVILIASGSEVALALEAHRQLQAREVPTRVVSMPCWSLFDAQDEAYRDSVLLPHCSRRLAIEAGSPIGWHKYVGPSGRVQAMETFGASAPQRELARAFGFTPEAVIRQVEQLL